MGKRSLFFALLLPGLLLLSACQPLVAQLGGEPVPTHIEAYVMVAGELDIEQGMTMYEKIATSAWNKGDRDLAEIRLATLEWRVLDDHEGARSRLERVAEKGELKVEALMMLAKMQISLADYGDARETAQHISEEAATPAQSRIGPVLLAQAVIEERVTSRMSKANLVVSANEAPEQEAELKKAQSSLQEFITAEPGNLEPAQLWLQASLLLNDGKSALEAWRAYYWLLPGEKPEGDLEEPYETLQEILPHWKGETAPASERERLVEALAASRFYLEAALVGLDPSSAQPVSSNTAEIVAYARFLEEMKKDLDLYYAKGLAEGYSVAAQTEFREAVENLCSQVNCPEGRGPQAKENYIRDRFGALWEFGRTHYLDVYMGHIILDQERTIEQYGKSANIRLLRVDHLVSHGIRSWVFDELFFVGGYALYDRYVEFRPFRVKLLMGLAQRVTDPDLKEDIANAVENERKQDEKAAAENPYAYLPGLNSRLVQRSLEAIWKDVVQPDKPEGEQKMHFLVELDAVWQEGPMEAHEGRHIIDAQRGNNSQVAAEFGAKLAETAFCRYPGIPLGANILYPYGIAGHSEANSQVVEGYVSWMEANASQISGLDPDQPLLPQLDLLSDDQLREVARGLDPLAASQG